MCAEEYVGEAVVVCDEDAGFVAAEFIESDFSNFKEWPCAACGPASEIVADTPDSCRDVAFLLNPEDGEGEQECGDDKEECAAEPEEEDRAYDGSSFWRIWF